jgi:hypothetical protein
MPPDLKRRIEESARGQGRTLHAEILLALETLYPAPTPMEEIRNLIDEAISGWLRSGDTSQKELDALRAIRDDLDHTLKVVTGENGSSRERTSDDDIPF